MMEQEVVMTRGGDGDDPEMVMERKLAKSQQPPTL
jgi:hypothetical protein